MSDPNPPPDAADIMTVAHEAVGGLELEPAEKREAWRFARRELPYLWNQRTSYFILDSYRDPYVRQPRAVQNGLTRRLDAYPFMMRDLIELPIDRLNMFGIMFSLLATYSDCIIGVFEKESGGEMPELGEIDDPPYFERPYVYPCDYSWITDAHLESKHHVIQAVLEITSTDDSTENEAAPKIKSLFERTQDTGINIAKDEIWEVLSNQTGMEENPAMYSRVHLNKFREFGSHDWCFPWTTGEEL